MTTTQTTNAQQGNTLRATTEATATCPDWCTLTEHEDWYLGGQGLERDHTARLLLDGERASVDVVGVERLVLHFSEIENGARISEAHHYERAVPVVQLDAPPQGVDLDAVELRRLIAALQEALAIIEDDNASADPLDQGNKRARIDGSGAIWEWSSAIKRWRHVSGELDPVATVAELNATAGPVRFEGAGL